VCSHASSFRVSLQFSAERALLYVAPMMACRTTPCPDTCVWLATRAFSLKPYGFRGLLAAPRPLNAAAKAAYVHCTTNVRTGVALGGCCSCTPCLGCTIAWLCVCTLLCVCGGGEVRVRMCRLEQLVFKVNVHENVHDIGHVDTTCAGQNTRTHARTDARRHAGTSWRARGAGAWRLRVRTSAGSKRCVRWRANMATCVRMRARRRGQERLQPALDEQQLRDMCDNIALPAGASMHLFVLFLTHVTEAGNTCYTRSIGLL
jgi:hypothetical protein